MDITVVCECGQILDAGVYNNQIVVEPCEKCLENAKDEGYSGGYNDGHQEGYDKGVEAGE